MQQNPMPAIEGSTAEVKTTFNAGQRGPIALIILFGVFGVGFMTIGVWLLVLQQYRLAVYQPTPATVVSSHVSTHHGRHGTSYWPAITYAYSVGGQSYRSDRVFPAGGMPDFNESAWQTVARYPAGAAITAWYDPAEPGSAFLIHFGSYFPFLFILFPSVFVIVSLDLLASMLRISRTPPPPAPFESGWFRVAEQGTIGGRFRLMATALVLWIIVSIALCLDYYLLKQRVADRYLAILGGIGIVVAALLAYFTWSRWQLCHDFLDAIVQISKPSIHRGDIVQFRVQLPVRRDVEISDLAVGLVCICDARLSTAGKTRYSSAESWSHWNKLMVQRHYAAGSHLEAQEKLALPADANPTTARFGGYPFYRWYIALEVSSPQTAKLRFRYPIVVE
jgi:hypothetical protein